MDKVEIQIIQPQPLHRAVKGFHSLFISMLAIPELGGDEELFTWNTAVFNCSTDTLLILIDSCCINVAIASLKGG